MNFLRINGSARFEGSVTHRLADAVIGRAQDPINATVGTAA